jgi:N-acetylneuraminic acid mutarotase
MQRRFSPTIILAVSFTPMACSLIVSSELDGKSSEAVSQDAGKEASEDADASGDRAETEPLDGEAGACDADRCGGVCTDLMTDAKNCGACGNACPSGRACTSGSCEGGFRAMATDGAPTARLRACAAWTGKEMFVWGGVNGEGNFVNSGGAYDPTTDTWRGVNTNGAPSPRELATCVAMDGGVFVWSGADGTTLYDDGAVWDPASNTWSGISNSNKPSPRIRGIGLWTGERVLLWGGKKLDGTQERSGALFDPVANAWKPVATSAAPERSKEQGWAWTGAFLYTFGSRDDAEIQVASEFHRYDPASNAWAPVLADGAPSPRSNPFVVWTGTHLLVWGGLDSNRVGLNDGASFDPAASSWAPMSAVQPPSGRGIVVRSGWTAWTGDRMLVAGGVGSDVVAMELALYDPKADPDLAWGQAIAWEPLNPHELGVGVWSGKELIVWGGSDGSSFTTSGVRWMP